MVVRRGDRTGIIHGMSDDSDQVTFTIPRQAWSALAELPPEKTRRMHELLYRNTDDLLKPEEKRELEALVDLFNFGQLIREAIQSKP